jgi:hypothetical protein
MQAVAKSAGVTAAEYDTLSAKVDSYQDARSVLRNTVANFPDPDIYYTQHLRGFFRGESVARSRGKNVLESDIQSISAEVGDTPAQTAVLRRDAQYLKQVGAAVTSQTNAQLGTAFVGAFAQGAPDAQAQAELETTFSTLLGPGTTPVALAASQRLLSDTTAFAQATGSSQANVQTITTDVQNLVRNGGGAAPNPFRVQVVRRPN